MKGEKAGDKDTLHYRAEIHCHTTVSDGSMSPEALVRLARHKGLAAIAVTDHNSFRGSVLAARISRIVGGPLVVYGNEVRSDHGDVLLICGSPASGVPSSLVELWEWAGENGCALVAAHPYHPGRSSIGWRIRGLLDYFHAVEVWNSRGLPFFNAPAIHLARSTGKPATSGSDAHVPRELGTSPIILPDEPRRPEDLVEWIIQGRVRPVFGVPSPLVVPEALAWALLRRIRPPG